MKIEKRREFIKKYSAETVIKELAPYVTDRRKARIDDVLTHRLGSIQLAIESPSDINNALATIRSCEALGISTIHIIHPEGDAGSIHMTTQGAFYWVDIIYYDSLDAFLEKIKQKNYLLAGGIVDANVTLTDIPIEKPICLIFGNEQRGLSQETRAACDFLFSITMVGMSESFNLSVSAAISLYDTSQRKRQALPTKGDLSPSQQTTARAHFYMNSVKTRLIEGLLDNR